MHGLDTLPALTATFASLDDEEADYDAVKALYHDGHLIDGSDAVGTAKNDEGKAAIAKKQSSRCGRAPGLMARWGWRPARVALSTAAVIGAGSGAVQEAFADAG